ncbi:sensor histidine kinase [Ornithinimicrobium pratense]|uniref:histidine kinase n=1 Tax=Ornithinimicrobium pratense TaxID=2593973 RepID=A0A5J6V7R2_9MICO|nr:HAMP domain-containing sensor histidine kinase [Ornithinimicrobium pratense]QFG69597.1 HAMP domain-containing histidine kinase [Ornithinimicrobium pratense]
MRSRLIVVLVALAVAIVALYGLPRAYFLTDLIHDAEAQETRHVADIAAIAIAERGRGADDVTPDFLESFLQTQESLTFVAADGSRVRVGFPAEADSAEDIVATRPLPDGGEITLRRSADLIDQRVEDALMPLFLVGLALVILAPLLMWGLAERLSRPFRELAGVAERIGQGHFDEPIRHHRVAEAEAIAEALRRASARWAELMRRERDIAANASHELRTPISALRVEIEDLASWPQTPPDVAAELHSYLPQLDRLNAAVRTYLDAAQAQRLTDVDTVDLVPVVRAAMQRWEAPAEGARSAVASVLVEEPEGPMPVRASQATVGQILDLLFRDAVDRGATLVRVQLGCTDAFGRVRLSLEGETSPTGDKARAAASQTALEVDGRVSIVDGHSTLLLPRAPGGTASRVS